MGGAHNTFHGTPIVDANGKEVPWVDVDGKELTDIRAALPCPLPAISSSCSVTASAWAII